MDKKDIAGRATGEDGNLKQGAKAFVGTVFSVWDGRRRLPRRTGQARDDRPDSVRLQGLRAAMK